MCDSCGCDSSSDPVTISKPGSHFHGHGHPHDHSHDHDHVHVQSRTVRVEQDVLAHNQAISEKNRAYFAEHGIFAMNLVSSPGSGKTTLLEKTITDLKHEVLMSVIEGDQQTARDADRIDATGVPVVQVNTGSGCHLDGTMIANAIAKLEPEDRSVLFIENVGNLVCPALFDLGESAKVVIISVTEGEDKPEKYPYMFRAARLCLINKIDLLPHLDFDVAACREFAARVNPELEFIEVSARTGEGMGQWYAWLKSRLPVDGHAG
ncbi:MAG: hydrogenase nickel incorporation protein HypB [Proteobacteria bacterium]|nr:hydrogenase nickel incorporation protein HypB [Pseudomonadota bacterium]MBU1736582.1 hydrogenase nickel incorporation protein HypB [Pseudomonadota bacterium]